MSRTPCGSRLLDPFRSLPCRTAGGWSRRTGISEIYVNEKGELIITLTDNTVHNVGKIVGEDGQNGINGADGQNGKDGEDGKDGTNGIDGQDGKDGRGIYDISLNNAGELIITLSDNTVYNLGIITGADGKDGNR